MFHNLSKQITLFLNAVNQYQPNVNVIGFYEINRGLLGSVSGGIYQRSPTHIHMHHIDIIF